MVGIRRSGRFLLAVVLLLPLMGASPAGAPKSPVLTAMEQELERTWKEVKRDPQAPLYFLSYTITDIRAEELSAGNGAITQDDSTHNRGLDVSPRVGTPSLDNTHELRGGGGFGGGGATPIPVDDDADAIRGAIWAATDQKIKAAQERFIRVQTNRAVKVEEEHPAPDFSKEDPHVDIRALPTLHLDREAWKKRIRELSRRPNQYPFVLDSSISLQASAAQTFLANSEGTRLQFGRMHVRLAIALAGMADDGMSLERSEIFDASDFSGLPKDVVVLATIDRLASELKALRTAPLVEPFTGPAILRNRASGVFFHEIFGHRIEGHRQKRTDEGQTFAAKVGQPILPTFLSVVDDPTMPKLGNQDLNGYYPYDDEGVPAQRVTLVDKGVLKEFLLSRSPLPGFAHSNGHGRRQAGRDAISRQGNLTVISSKQVPYGELRKMLVDECRRQKKPYGLIFDDISGGFTMTTRDAPQAFKVQPLMVHRVYADGRPDELVRGVDIVGTPLASFSKILATANDTDVFNGYCGAESGWVPVSAISPSILVSELEIEKRQKGTDRPPLLPPPSVSAVGQAVSLPSEGTKQAGSLPQARPKVPAGDTLLKALADELQRTRAQLKMDTFAPPYFVAYTAQDNENMSVAAGMGALIASDRDHSRRLWADVRVGNANLDNTNFGGRGGGGVASADDLPLEDEYDATRRAVWLATDDAYKAAIETLSNKRAALRNQVEEQRPPDLGKADPFTLTADPPPLEADRAAWETKARTVSAVFRRFPKVEDGRLIVSAQRQTQRFVNSEGSWNRTGSVLWTAMIQASVRMSDNNLLTDARRFYARSAAGLPSQEALIAAAEALANSLTELAAAKETQEYSGPVLFTGDAAPMFFDLLLGAKLSDPAVPVTPDGRAGQFARSEKLAGPLGRRVLPAGFRVVDDPTKDAADGTPLLGSYAVDDDGVPAAAVTLVEDGLLKAFYMGRIPTKEIALSNGHGRRAMGGRVTGQPANLLVSTTATNADLKERLKALCKEDGLEYGLMLERFDTSPGGGRRGGFGGRGFGGRGAPPQDRSDLPPALGFRKIYADGHEELLRGGRIVGVTARTLRNIAAAGTDRNAATRRLSPLGASAVTVVAPSIVVTGLDVRPDDSGAEKPPLIPRPTATKG
jgi:TldD protein